jgi:hypothetical protein
VPAGRLKANQQKEQHALRWDAALDFLPAAAVRALFSAVFIKPFF